MFGVGKVYDGLFRCPTLCERLLLELSKIFDVRMSEKRSTWPRLHPFEAVFLVSGNGASR